MAHNAAIDSDGDIWGQESEGGRWHCLTSWMPADISTERLIVDYGPIQSVKEAA